MTRDQGVLVLGMHRSGTSAVTAALVALGLGAGRGALMGAMPSNPTGHWEVERLTAFDDDVLRALGGRWSGPPPEDPSAAAALARGPMGWLARLHLDAVFGGEAGPAGWVWKDPRACLVLPFWKEVLGDGPRAVAVIRHPVAVARSLAARNGFSVDYGLALWERHTRATARDLRGGPVVVVAYDDLMADPELVEVLAADMAQLGVAVDLTRVGTAADVLMGDHRHHQPEHDDRLTPGQLALWLTMEALVGCHQAFPTVALPDETPGLQTAFREHTRMAQWEERANARTQALEQRDREIVDLRREVENRSADTQARIDELLALAEQREALLLGIYERWPVRAWMALRRMRPGSDGDPAPFP